MARDITVVRMAKLALATLAATVVAGAIPGLWMAAQAGDSPLDLMRASLAGATLALYLASIPVLTAGLVLWHYEIAHWLIWGAVGAASGVAFYLMMGVIGELFPGFIVGGLATALTFRMIMMRLDRPNRTQP